MLMNRFARQWPKVTFRREKVRGALFVMVAEPSKASAPAAPSRRMPWILILVLNLMETGGDVELMDDFMNEEVNVVNFPYKNMENEQDMVTKEWMSRDWCPADDGLSCGHDSTMDFEMNSMRWIGTTEISAVECPLSVGQLKVGSMGGGETSTVEDWRFDFSCLEDFNTKTVQELSLDSEPVQDWGLDYTNESCVHRNGH